MATHTLIHASLSPPSHRAVGQHGPVDHGTASDESLVRRAQAGDREAFVAVYHRYVNEIFGYAYHQLGNAQDAEDVTSETFLRLVTALDGFDHRASFRTWLYTVARNQLRDRWRVQDRQPTLTLLDDVDASGARLEHDSIEWMDGVSADPDMAGDAAQMDAAATTDSPWPALGKAVMAALPERYRTVLTLRIAHGRSIRDTAEAMGTTPGNVKVLQHRALKRAADVAAALQASGTLDRAPARR